MQNNNQTASQILEAYSYDLSAKMNLFRSHYGFFPAREGTIDFEVLAEPQQRLCDAFYRHPRVAYLEARIADWSEQCHLLKVRGK